ncbi:deoxyribonuclease IV [Rubrobacter taiwanensis]|uniref:deoxyribonuclease IV n=1 Tax=Rubrobacter taiwanensis TaxID=185139 RepID=UPI00140496F0|nr:deoxyribonuclease IV [Rubrobacter taiwanensis]
MGRHLPTSGGLRKTLKIAEEWGCEAVQIFVSNPQGWAVPGSRPDAAAFREGAAGLCPVVVHAKYLINLATRREDHWQKSAEALAAEVRLAASLGADFVVFHPGSAGASGGAGALERAARGVARVLELAGGVETELVIENSAGAGTQLCADFASLGELARKSGLRVCVDTAHAHVAGYDLSVPENVPAFMEELEENVGLKRVALLHLNDAKNPAGSRRDGHRRIGEGRIPLGSWRELFAALPGVPLVMETPYSTPEVNIRQIRLVKELAGGLPIVAARV